MSEKNNGNNACNSVRFRSKLINDINTAVTESLKGFVMSNPNVIMADFGNIIMVKNYARLETVKIVSGGGSGHEPSYAGFVGKGMLTAAIQGEIYTSPTASDILRLLKELSFKSNRGILLIIQNNFEERLHFGLAVEKAKNEAQVRIETLLVDDDCYFNKSWKGRRGLSGIILLQKIAGAMADADLELEEIYEFCQKVLEQINSISMSLQSLGSVYPNLCVCSSAGGRVNDNPTVEVGLSLNGEPGTMKELKSATEICKFILEEITSSNVSHALDLNPNVPLVVLVNNLGTATKMEELILIKELLQQIYNKGLRVARLYSGKFITALDTAGFSVTFLRVIDETIIRYLDAPCEVSNWSNFNNFELTAKLNRTICTKYKADEYSVLKFGPKLTERESNTLMTILHFACDALYACEKQLNTIGMECGDGDTGTRLRRGTESIDNAIKNRFLNLEYPFLLFQSMSKLIEQNVGGSLGLIYSVFFEAASNVFRETSDSVSVDSKLWLTAFKEANSAVKKYTKVEAGYRTIYDPLYVCATLLEEGLGRNISLLEAINIAVSATEEAARKTKTSFNKYPDPGAHTASIWIRAVYEGIKSRWVEE